ncbi:MAG: phosphatidylserine/phosphatidylglycerophosphate/cardiolipin synthase family protein [bacterium]|nr:phosphatidylserine/phosphatidylglycerophosphate/cardiolipin synthase family protein [bacterium]
MIAKKFSTKKSLVMSTLSTFIMLGVLISAALPASAYWKSEEAQDYLNNLAELNDQTVSRTAGNWVQLLPEATSNFKQRQDLIFNADSIVNLYTLCMSGDVTGKGTSEAMIAAAMEDVEVNFIYQPISQKFWGGGEELITAMRNAGIGTREYWPSNPKWYEPYNKLMLACHKKSLITDSKEFGLEAITGGRNIGDDYLANIPEYVDEENTTNLTHNRWRDTDMLLRGPAAYEVQEDFIRTFNETTSSGESKIDASNAKYFPQTATGPVDFDADKLIAKPATVHVLENEPDRNNGNGIFQLNKLLKKAISKAEKSIDIHTPYMIPPREILNPLEEAAKRGVKVRIIATAPGRQDMGEAYILASAYLWEEVMDAGIEFYMWNMPIPQEGMSRLIHSKVFIFDSEMVMISSLNLTYRSFYNNTEYGVVMTGDDVVAVAEKMYENDINIKGDDPNYQYIFRMTKKWMDDNFDFMDRIGMNFYYLVSGFFG